MNNPYETNKGNLKRTKERAEKAPSTKKANTKNAKVCNNLSLCEIDI